MRWLRLALAIGLPILALALPFGLARSWLQARSDRSPPPSGALVASGLEGPVRISRDEIGVPHIDAQSAADAYFGLGLAHAQDRLFQLELLRRSARGELSELFGARALPADRLARTLGLHVAAEAEWSALRPSVRLLLIAYSRGINRWIEHVQQGQVRRPFELEWLDLELAPWTPQDSLLLVRFRAWMLGRSLGQMLLLDRLVREVGGLATHELFPDPLPEGDLVGSLLRLGRAADQWAASAGLAGRVGSSGFVVGASRSRGGHPLLANDPHVELRIPSLFYVAHLRMPGFEVAGGTWPGIPVFFTGSNRSIAWGQVALAASTSDLFDESLSPDAPHLYDWGGRWRRIDLRQETIRVRGGREETIEVASTRHGPLLGSVDSELGPARNYALRWTGGSGPSGIEALLELERARSWPEFRAALATLPAPAATFLYADRDGNVGSQVAGRLPLRTIDTGLLPVPGRSSFYDWRGFIPFEELPASFGPEIPFLVASTRPASASFGQPIAWLWDRGRGSDERLRRALAGHAALDLLDVVRIQSELRAQDARNLARRLLRDVQPATGPSAHLRRILLEWDGATDTDSAGAAAYYVLRRRLTEKLLEERIGRARVAEVLAVSEPLPGALLARFLERAENPAARELVLRSLDEAASWLSFHVSSNPAKWTWGRVHQLRLEHPFESLGDPVARLIGRALSRGPFPVPGGLDSVFSVEEAWAPSKASVGPGLRLAVDLGDPDHLLFSICGGQSGHPAAAHYDDALADWLAARARPLWLHPVDVAYHERGAWEVSPPPR